MSAAREATRDDSTGSRGSRRDSRGGARGVSAGQSRLRLALAALAAAAAVMLIVSEFLPLYKITTGTLNTVKDSEVGWRTHAFAMLLLALASVPMILGALRGARPAMWALAGIGIVVIVVALTVDLSTATDEREFGLVYDDTTKAKPSTGFYVETAAGVLLILSAGLMLLLAPARREPAERGDAI